MTSNLRCIRMTPLMPERLIGLTTTLVRRIAIIIHLNIPLMMCRWRAIRHSALSLVTQRLVTTIEEGKGWLSRCAWLTAVAFPATAAGLARTTTNRQNPEERRGNGERDSKPIHSHHLCPQRECDVVRLEGGVEGGDDGGEDGGR